MWLSLIVAAYLGMWFVTWTGVLAELQGSYPMLARKDYRRDLGLALFVGFLPPGWIVALFMTGFYQHGFQVWPLKARL